MRFREKCKAKFHNFKLYLTAEESTPQGEPPAHVAKPNKGFPVAQSSAAGARAQDTSPGDRGDIVTPVVAKETITLSDPAVMAVLHEAGVVDVRIFRTPSGAVFTCVVPESYGTAEGLSQSVHSAASPTDPFENISEPVDVSSKTSGAAPVEVAIASKTPDAAPTAEPVKISLPSSYSASALAAPGALELPTPALSEGPLDIYSRYATTPADAAPPTEVKTSTTTKSRRKHLVDTPEAYRKAKDKLKAKYQAKIAQNATKKSKDVELLAFMEEAESLRSQYRFDAKQRKLAEMYNATMQQFRQLSDDGDIHELYDSMKMMAKGTFGTIYTAKTLLPVLHGLPRDVAIKHIDLRDAILLPSMVNELSVTREINHPNIVRSFTSHMPHGCNDLYIVMEQVTGANLGSLLGRNDLTERQIATICREVLLALEHLHSRQIMHRDLKGVNVMIEEKGNVKLVDFGAAGRLSDPKAKIKGNFGSPGRVAPEALTGARVYNEKVDIYALGMMVIEMVDKAIPHRHMDRHQHAAMVNLHGPPQLKDPKAAGHLLNNFLAACLCVNVDKRASASSLLNHKFLRQADSVECLIPLLANSTKD